MNSCVLTAEVIQDPQLRHTPDNQTPITELWVQIAGLRDEEPPAKLKVVGWGNLAQEIQERYHVGDHVIIEGRLNMNTVERQEGFKEKRAELTAQKVHQITPVAPTPVAPTPIAPVAPAPAAKAKKTSAPAAPATSDDYIPF